MSVTSVHSLLLSSEDRARVAETLSELEASGSLPTAVQEPVLRLLRLVSHGHGAYVVPINQDLTTTEAARVLGMSRPFLTRLLDEGHIPCHRTGRDRRVASEDVIEYLRQRDETKKEFREAAASRQIRRQSELAALAGISPNEAEELGFG